MRLAFFGGLYNNYLALEAAIADARCRGVDAMYCLGDMGAFGPYPDRVFPLLHDADVHCIQGNYDHSIGNDLQDCQCGYTDPRDNHFAAISYKYTYANTNPINRAWLRDLPAELSLEFDGVRFLLCHGSPRRTNEFLWESNTSTHFLDKMAADRDVDLILGTHTGIHWTRSLADGRQFVNAGVLGRPENDGRTNVWYTMVRTGADMLEPAPPDRHFEVEFVPLQYDHQRLAYEMQSERLPEEFIATVKTGWWTTCLEVLPAKERRRGQF